MFFRYSGNAYLDGEKNSKRHIIIVLCCVVGFSVLLAAVLAYLFAHRKRELLSGKGTASYSLKIFNLVINLSAN